MSRTETLYYDGTVRVRCTVPVATQRRVQAAIKAKTTVEALKRALEVAQAAYVGAHGNLRGSEMTEFTRVMAGEPASASQARRLDAQLKPTP